MLNKRNKKIKILTLSAIIMAMYIVLMYTTSSFAFGPYQIRIATSIYALSYIFPFLIIPLGLANSMSNLIGGLGLHDIIGGFIVGLLTCGCIALLQRFKLTKLLVIPVIIVIPGFIVPIWLSPITGLPYLTLVISLCIGQTLPAIVGYILISFLSKSKIPEIMKTQNES